MDFFAYRDGVLHAEDVALPAIADTVGTPVHVYSAGALRHAAGGFKNVLAGLPAPRLAFAVKANPNTAVLRLLAREGYGADIVSGGELRRALGAGMAPAGIVFSGVGKTDRELGEALDRVRRGDLAVFHTTGAYGAAMASSYNCRPLSPQVLVDGDTFQIVGDRILPAEMAA